MQYSYQQGLYKDDERLGPGVMTYGDNTQDIGLWHKEKLVKICTPISGAFTIHDHKEFVFSPEEHTLYINMNEEDRKPGSREKMKSTDIFDYLPENQLTDKVTDMYNETLDPGSLAINRSEFNREFFKEQDGEKSDGDEKVVAINRTPGMIEIQKHVHRHRNREKSMSFDVQEVMKGSRGGNFKQRGPLETASEELIMAAAQGDVKKVEDLLTSGKVHPDVADKNGHTALIGASVSHRSRKLNSLIWKMLCKRCLRLDMLRIYCLYYFGLKCSETVMLQLAYKIRALVQTSSYISILLIFVISTS